MPVEGANVQMEVRCVIYSPEHGTYLGDDNWSKTNPGGKTAAPTFLRSDADEVVAELVIRGKYPTGGVLVAEARMVYPDKPKKYASVEACANAGLPRW